MKAFLFTSLAFLAVLIAFGTAFPVVGLAAFFFSGLFGTIAGVSLIIWLAMTAMIEILAKMR